MSDLPWTTLVCFLCISNSKLEDLNNRPNIEILVLGMMLIDFSQRLIFYDIIAFCVFYDFFYVFWRYTLSINEQLVR